MHGKGDDNKKDLELFENKFINKNKNFNTFVAISYLYICVPITQFCFCLINLLENHCNTEIGKCLY